MTQIVPDSLCGTLPENLEEENRPSDRRVEARDSTCHRNANEEIDLSAHGGREPLPFSPNDETDRTTEVGLAIGLGRFGLSAHHPNPPEAQCSELLGKVVNAGDEEVFNRPSTRLDRCGGEGRGPRAPDHDPVHADRLSAADHAPEVLRIFDAIKGDDEGGLVTSDRARKDLFWRGFGTAAYDKCHPLVSVEPSQLADDGTLNLDDRDPDGRCMQNNLLEGVAPLRHDKEFH